MTGYYAAAAQIIPLLVLALLVDRRITGSDQDRADPGQRAVAILLIGVLSVIGEGVALKVLLEGGPGAPNQAGVVATAIAGLTLALFLVTIAPSLSAWWKQPEKKLEWRLPRKPRKEWAALMIATLLFGSLMSAAYVWAESFSP